MKVRAAASGNVRRAGTGVLLGLACLDSGAQAAADRRRQHRRHDPGGIRRTATPLYRAMPPHGAVALEHAIGGWSTKLTLRVAARNTRVDALRLQPPTGGYASMDLRTSWERRNVRLDLAVSNFLDRQYANPLGGTWQSALYAPGYAGASFRSLPAAGRSVDTGFSVKF